MSLEFVLAMFSKCFALKLRYKYWTVCMCSHGFLLVKFDVKYLFLIECSNLLLRDMSAHTNMVVSVHYVCNLMKMER